MPAAPAVPVRVVCATRAAADDIAVTNLTGRSLGATAGPSP